VGWFISPPDFSLDPHPDDGDAAALEWLGAGSKPAVYASFGTEAFPTLAHLDAIVNGTIKVRAAGMGWGRAGRCRGVLAWVRLMGGRALSAAVASTRAVHLAAAHAGCTGRSTQLPSHPPSWERAARPDCRPHPVLAVPWPVQAGLRVLLLVRKEVLAHHGLAPADLAAGHGDDVLVLNWVDAPRKLLAHPSVAAFVCHGGVKSTAEGIYEGVPLVMLTVNGAS
jgi:hypothetical protein